MRNWNREPSLRVLHAYALTISKTKSTGKLSSSPQPQADESASSADREPISLPPGGKCGGMQQATTAAANTA